MSLRIAIQDKITDLVEAGTFSKIVYTTGRTPAESGEFQTPQSVIVNEVSGRLTDSSRTGATSVGFVLTNWRFECVVQFPCEVDVSQFMLSQLRIINFTEDNLLVSIVPTGDFRVTHPPRDGSHSGTKLIIGLTVNTRR